MSRFSAVGRIALVLAVLIAAGAGEVLALTTTPVASPAGGAPWDPAYTAHLAVANEAELKKRLGRAGVKAAAEATPGMADYDVTWYDLVLDLDPAAEQVVGTTTVRAYVVAASLDVVDLNFNPLMTVTEARSDASTLAFVRAGDVLSAGLVLAGTRIARRARDPFTMLLAFGMTALISVPAAVNAGVVMGLLPTTGFTLPFLSFGGTSFLCCCVAIGILLRIGAVEAAPERPRVSGASLRGLVGS